MSNRLVIIGAGGHGKVIADNALKRGYTDINFVDDSVIDNCTGFPVIGTIDEINVLNDGQTDFVIGIGNNKIRKMIAEKYEVNWVSLIHPSVQIAANVSVGTGTVLMAGAVVNASAKIGNHCIINTGAVIEHDNIIEDYVHISPKVALGGTVRIAELTHIGIGATVVNNVYVCRKCTIGAGTVVIKNIEHSGTYVGVPAKEVL